MSLGDCERIVRTPGEPVRIDQQRDGLSSERIDTYRRLEHRDRYLRIPRNHCRPSQFDAGGFFQRVDSCAVR